MKELPVDIDDAKKSKSIRLRFPIAVLGKPLQHFMLYFYYANEQCREDAILTATEYRKKLYKEVYGIEDPRNERPHYCRTLCKANTSGETGIAVRKHESSCIYKGVRKRYFNKVVMASWQYLVDGKWKTNRTSFSIKKYGLELAWQLAVDRRYEMITYGEPLQRLTVFPETISKLISNKIGSVVNY